MASFVQDNVPSEDNAVIIELVDDKIRKNTASCCPKPADADINAKQQTNPRIIRFMPAAFPKIIATSSDLTHSIKPCGLCGHMPCKSGDKGLKTGHR